MAFCVDTCVTVQILGDNIRSGSAGVSACAFNVLWFLSWADCGYAGRRFFSSGASSVTSPAAGFNDCCPDPVARPELWREVRADGRRAVGGYLLRRRAEMAMRTAFESGIVDPLRGVRLGGVGDVGDCVLRTALGRAGAGGNWIVAGGAGPGAVYGECGGVRGGDCRVAAGAGFISVLRSRRI